MNKALANNWNSKITKEDTVYHLGDFALGCRPRQMNEIIGSLNFAHLHLIKGNHEKSFADWYREKRPNNVSFYGSYLETKLQGRDFTLCHYAMRIFNKKHHNALHLYGHSHGTLPDDPHAKSMDVGVDTNNYYPYLLDDVIKILDAKEIKPVDHHGK